MRTIKNILVPVDVMEDADFVAEDVRLFAEKLEAKVTLLYARPPLDRFFDTYLTDDVVSQLQEDSKQRALKEMKNLVAEHLEGLDVQIELTRGQPHEVILRKVQKGDFDLVIMGTHCRHGVDRIMFGSVANRVVKQADIPVLTIHPDHCKEQ